ncbi:hypothetical protein C7E20_07175 [Sphingobium sp. AEW4]|nr:hypothetical protein C7E20_07175 [Sphingobium sp. AEW4]
MATRDAATSVGPFDVRPTPNPFGLSLSKPPPERSEGTSLRSVVPFDFAQGERVGSEWQQTKRAPEASAPAPF